MRGLFTAGVTDVMMEAGIVFDGAIGVSAGAVFGGNYKAGQAGRVLRYNLRFCKDPPVQQPALPDQNRGPVRGGLLLPGDPRSLRPL